MQRVRSHAPEAATPPHVKRFLDLRGVVPAIAPPLPVTEVLAQAAEHDDGRDDALARHLLANRYRLPERNLVLLRDIDQALSKLVAQIEGPVIVFPPSDLQAVDTAVLGDREVVSIARGVARDGIISVDTASDLPHGGVAVIASPGNPLGNVLVPNDAVRLARSCRWLIIDERFTDYAGQSLLNVANEFSNVIVVRSFQANLGEIGARAGWAAGSSQASKLLSQVATDLPPGFAQAVLAHDSSKYAGRMHIAQSRDERSRLYRALRKLSYVQPLPSWGPFVAARIEIGDRETFVALLAASGIQVHTPAQPGLDRYVRIGIGTRSAMEHLRRSLIEIAPEMLGPELPCGGGDTNRLPLCSEEFGEPQFGEVKQRGQRCA